MNTLDEAGFTVLNCSTFQVGNAKCLKFLINQGTNVNGISNCSERGGEFIFAMSSQKFEISKILLENGDRS